MNQRAQAIVEAVLADPGSRLVHWYIQRFGRVIDVWAADGRGLRYSEEGRFIGFLEPENR